MTNTKGSYLIQCRDCGTWFWGSKPAKTKWTFLCWFCLQGEL